MVKKRVEAYGNIYHIIQWGKSEVFVDSNDKLKFLESIGGAKEKYDFLLIAYSIMNDHYHLVIKTHNISLSKIMQSINTRFGKYYSKNHNDNPLKGRYKSIVIKEDNIFQLVNLIHNEPIHCGLVATMEEYPYISHAFYQMNVDSIVDINYLFNIISTDRMIAIEEYSKNMNRVPEDDDYKKLMKLYSEQNSVLRKKTMDLDIILKEICPNEIDFNLIKKGSKKSYLMDYKRKFINQAKDLGYSSKEIGQFINISDRAVRKHIHH